MPEERRAFRLGIIGAGVVAETYHLPVLSAMPDIDVAWVCDSKVERAIALARTYGIPKAYQDVRECSQVDAVLLAIPVGHRAAVLEQIFANKWHALIEKPFASNCAQHDWILQRARDSGVRVGVGFMRRFYAATILAQDMVERCIFGPIEEVWATEGYLLRATGREAGWYLSDRRASGGGVLIETGSHLIDQVVTLCRVRDFHFLDCRLEYRGDSEYEARILGTLDLENGRSCKFGLAVSWLEDLYNAVVIKFASAQLKIPIVDTQLELCDADGRTIAHLDNPVSQNGLSGRPFRGICGEWRDFIRECVEAKSLRANAQSAQLTTKFVERCYQLQPPGYECRAPASAQQ